MNEYSTSTIISLDNNPRQLLELDIVVPENYMLPLQNYFMYVPGSARADIYVSGEKLRSKPVVKEAIVFRKKLKASNLQKTFVILEVHSYDDKGFTS